MAIKPPFKRKKSETGVTLKRSFGASTVVHMLPLLLLITLPAGCIPGCGGGGGGNSDQKNEQKKDKAGTPPDDKEIKEKNDPVEVEIVNRPPPEKSEEQIAYEAAKKKQEDCKPFFGGIGIQINTKDASIMKVYKYYPAWSSGLKEGDTILNFEEIMGKVGTDVVVKYVRNGQNAEVNITRGKICLEDAVKNLQPETRNPNAG